MTSVTTPYGAESERDRTTKRIDRDTGTDSGSGVDEWDERCPECDGSLVSDEAHGEVVCGNCDLVVTRDTLDRGPDWYQSDDDDTQTRVGPPVTSTRHDKGLSTTIDWRDVDANDNPLGERKRRQMSRLRTWDERFRTRDSKDRTLRGALIEIERLTSALELPDRVKEEAAVIFRRALENDLLPGRSVEGMTTASIYAAARFGGVPRSLDETAEVSRVDRTEIGRSYRYVSQELDLTLEPIDPRTFVRRFVSSLEYDLSVERTACELIEAAEEEKTVVGTQPVTIACGAIYAATLITDEPSTQEEIAETANVSTNTIRRCYRDMLDAVGGPPL